MSMTVVKCFSVLVVAGRGERCNRLRELLAETLLVKDRSTGFSRLWIHKFGRAQHASLHLEIRKEIGRNCNDLYLDINSKYFGTDVESKPNTLSLDFRQLVDKLPIRLDPGDSAHCFIFRKLLEQSMTQGRWHGFVPRLS